MDGPRARKIESYFEELDEIITPAVVLYEVYKYVKRERSEEEALLHSAFMMRTRLEPFSEASALWAADVSLEQGLSMADAMVFAAAQKNRALLVTLDSDFKDLPGVEYLGK